MLRPFLIVGVGGSGGKTIRALKVVLERRLRETGWSGGLPEAWQFLHVDTPTVQDGETFPAPFLSPEEYIGIVPSGVGYQPLVSSLIGKPYGAKLNDVELAKYGGWIPSPGDVKVPVNQGAGQFRAIGRTLAVAKLEEVRARLLPKFSKMNGPAARGQLTEVAMSLGQPDKLANPTVLVISSIAGGSGAGAYLDVIEAIKSCDADEWAQRVIAWLYTPDVFDGISGNSGVAPNALSAIAETMSGTWAKSVSLGTDALYRSKGMNQVNLQESNVGPRYAFLVGRKNASADFGSQESVYLATAASLGAFMTDGSAQDNFWAYYITNLDANATLDATLPDRSRLKIDNVQRPPFLAMGFARVSTGRDKFRDFAGQRLTRDVIERMLQGHKRILPNEEVMQKNEDELIQQAADQAWLDFLERSALNERNPANDVINALTSPEVQNRALSYAQQAFSSAGVDAKGVSPDLWTTKIFNFFNLHRQAFLDEEAATRNALARKWVEDISTSFPAHVSEYISQIGLPATARLLTKLSEEISFSVRELEQDADKSGRYARELQSGISQALSVGMANLAPNHPALQTARDRVKIAFAQISGADTCLLAAELLADFEQNVLRQILAAVQSASSALTTAWNAERLVDTRVNPVKLWPDPLQQVVPVTFNPPPNERVLLPTSAYLDVYQDLVNRTIPQDNRGQYENNATVVAKQVLMGSALPAPDGGPSKLDYVLISREMDWVPKNAKARPARFAGAAAPARYRIEVDPLKYLQRTDSWMMQEGGQFHNYLSESLSSFLANGSVADGELVARRQTFMTEFQAALSASKPLVDINDAILSAVHPTVKSSDVAYTVSTIPFDANSDFGKSIVGLFPGSMVDQARSWFGSASDAREISITTFLSSPMQPMVFNSIMDRIASQWSKESTLAASREGFYKWRRARPLLEFIPAAPNRVESMIRGWILADVLGQIRHTQDPQLGAKVEVWDPGFGWVSFPYPLLHPGTPTPSEYLGSVLESLAIALVLSSSNYGNPLESLRAYHRLMDLGGESAEMANVEISDWIHRGTMPAGAPESPVVEATGAEARAKYLSERLQKKFADADKKYDTVLELGDPYRTNRAWEIHELRQKAIRDLQKTMLSLGEPEEI